MTPSAVRPAAHSLARLPLLLLLLAPLRRVHDPLAAPATAGRPCQAAATAGRPCQAAEGLRRSSEVVVQFTDLAGIDPACVHRPRSILPDPAIVQAAAALRNIQCVLGLVETDDSAASAALPMPAANVAACGLPTAIQVSALARKPDT
jgi:hypothetical protein